MELQRTEVTGYKYEQGGHHFQSDSDTNTKENKEKKTPFIFQCFRASLDAEEMLLPVAGIANVGNSCYMNSALQGLFASIFVTKRIAAYSKEKIPKNEKFMPSLQKLLVAYQSYQEKPSKKTSHIINYYASKLQSKLYRARLKQLGLARVGDMADADLIIMILGEVLRIEYTLAVKMAAIGGKATNGAYIKERSIKQISSDQLIWPEIKTNGGFFDLSLQKVFQDVCTLGYMADNLNWQTTTENGIEITIDKANVSYRIVGDPPPLIVFKVGKSRGRGMDAEFDPYFVKPRDEFLDASRACDNVHQAAYRLIAILQNHDRLHWTAIIRNNDCWYHCDDGDVTKLDQNIPNAKAAILIYELAT